MSRFMRERIRNYFERSIPTYATIAGEYYDDVEVLADYESGDDSVNIGESVTVCYVKVHGVDMLDRMLQSEVEELEDRILWDATDREFFPHFRNIKGAK